MILATAVAISACASVEDEQAAITIADKACADSWGRYAKQSGTPWNVDQESWHARLEADHWKVWNGDEGNPRLSIFVPRYGPRPKGVECDMRFGD